jgi:hypothetical protein
VTEAKIQDEDETVIDSMNNLPYPICPGTIFNYTNFITGQKKAT